MTAPTVNGVTRTMARCPVAMVINYVPNSSVDVKFSDILSPLTVSLKAEQLTHPQQALPLSIDLSQRMFYLPLSGVGVGVEKIALWDLPKTRHLCCC